LSLPFERPTQQLIKPSTISTARRPGQLEPAPGEIDQFRRAVNTKSATRKTRPTKTADAFIVLERTAGKRVPILRLLMSDKAEHQNSACVSAIVWQRLAAPRQVGYKGLE
jgi:hypothetical protein